MISLVFNKKIYIILFCKKVTWKKALDKVSHAEDTLHLGNTEFLNENQMKVFEK